MKKLLLAILLLIPTSLFADDNIRVTPAPSTSTSTEADTLATVTSRGSTTNTTLGLADSTFQSATGATLTLSGNMDAVGRVNSNSFVRAAKSDTDSASATTGLLTGDAYYVVGGREYNTNSYRNISFGYQASTNDYPPAIMGYQERDIDGNTRGDLVFFTRNTTGASDVPATRLRIDASGKSSFGGDVNATGSIIATNTSTASVVSVTANGGNYYLPYQTGASGQVAVLQADGTMVWDVKGGGTAGTTYYQTMEEEGVPVAQETNMNFTGAGVTVSDAGGKTVVNIPGGAGAAASGSILFTFSGGNSAIATGADAWVVVPYAATIKEWQVTTYSTCPVFTVMIHKGNYLGFAPNQLNEIGGSEDPTVTNGMRGIDTDLTTWTTSVSAGDYIYAMVSNVDNATMAVVYIGMTKS